MPPCVRDGAGRAARGPSLSGIVERMGCRSLPARRHQNLTPEEKHMTLRALVCAALLVSAPALAQTDLVTPPKALVLENVPPIPADLAKKLDPYGEFRPHGMLSWNPNKREML